MILSTYIIFITIDFFMKNIIFLLSLCSGFLISASDSTVLVGPLEQRRAELFEGLNPKLRPDQEAILCHQHSLYLKKQRESNKVQGSEERSEQIRIEMNCPNNLFKVPNLPF